MMIMIQNFDEDGSDDDDGSDDHDDDDDDDNDGDDDNDDDNENGVSSFFHEKHYFVKVIAYL